jgi:hypothetical protein
MKLSGGPKTRPRQRFFNGFIRENTRFTGIMAGFLRILRRFNQKNRNFSGKMRLLKEKFHSQLPAKKNIILFENFVDKLK